MNLPPRDPWRYVAIHHIDGDPHNNRSDNLRLVDVRDGGPLKPEQQRAVRLWQLKHSEPDE